MTIAQTQQYYSPEEYLELEVNSEERHYDQVDFDVEE